MVSLGMTYGIGATPGVSWREIDISAMIFAKDPRSTPFFEMSGNSVASSKSHHWQARGVKTRAINAQVEGANFTWAEVSSPTRLVNTTQIVENGIQISRTTRRESHYSINDIYQDQLDLRTTEHRGDVEFGLVRGVESAGTTAAASQMDGLVSVASSHATTNGQTLTETIYISILEDLWNSMDAPNVDCMTNAGLRKIIDTFDAEGSTKWVDSTVREIVNSVLVYHSSFGDVQNHLSRDLLNAGNATTGSELCMFDRSMMKKAWLDRPFITPVPKTGDRDETVVISELTLEYGNEAANAVHTFLKNA